MQPIPLHRYSGILALFLALSTPVVAGSLDEGLAAFNQKDYQTAFDLWKPLAESGDAKARYNLGLMFQRGLGVEKNLKQARLLFIAAAEQGDADAQYQIGHIYSQGEGVFRSNHEAKRWWEMAVAQQHPRAQYNLATFYAYGVSTKADHGKARELWQAAAEQGYSPAIEVMIRLHQSGEFGAERSEEKAEAWRQRVK